MFLKKLTVFSLDRPKTVIAVTVLLTLLFGLQFFKITIDTDPENMLEPTQEDRVFFDQTKEEFGVHDYIVVGIVDEQGIFRKEAVKPIYDSIKEIIKIKGVIITDLISLTTTNNVKSGGGMLDIHPVMQYDDLDDDEIKEMRADILSNPFLNEKIASEDGTATAIYVPIKEKKLSYGIAKQIKVILNEHLLPGQVFHLAGLPIAEDTFGLEMFIQMAVVAPLAFGLIMFLMYLMFRRVAFLLPVGMDAMFAVIWAMGLLIGTGNTVHIMSSMIPVFLMPIAILDDIHVLSEFFDRYRELGNKREAILEAMNPLYRPMLFTSLTSAVGFASLALTDIPPVRVFGLFVGFGIMMAWIFSMMVVPAVISLMDDEKLKQGIPLGDESGSSMFDKVLRPIGNLTFRHWKAILLFSLLLVAVGVMGITRIRINDNPVKWFKQNHALRVADREMNRLFGGTYMAYLVVSGEEKGQIKQPEVVEYIAKLQQQLESLPIVGKTSSVADIVKRINFVLHDNDPEYDLVPPTAEAVGQFLFLFQSSGDPNDLDSFINNEAMKANIWIQMKGGDNQQMQQVEDHLAEFIKQNPPPAGLTMKWSGLTYINKVWQSLMVEGMFRAIMGSFLVVFLMMLFEFRSLTLGILSMLPLTMAIVLSYGLVGWMGKDYDMPVAICSSLALGMAIDFAIHFIQRFRADYAHTGNFEETTKYMFGEPGRAIARNTVVISLGFLPLMASTLTPYITVGMFFAVLMIVSTFATLLLLPATLRLVEPYVLKKGGEFKDEY